MYLRKYFQLSRGVVEASVALSLYGIGVSLVGIFVPIFLLTLGYTLLEALLFVLVTKVFFVLLTPIAFILNARYGLQVTTLVRIPFFSVSYLSLLYLELYPVLFWVSSVTQGVALALFWLPMNTFFLHASKDETQGSDVGVFLSVPTFVKVLAPGVGGALAVLYGFEVLFLIGLFVVALSTIPLFFSSLTKTSSAPLRFSSLKKLLRADFFVMTVTDGFVHVASAVLFPLLIFVSLSSVESVGWIESLGMLFFAVGSFFVGRFLNTHGTRLVYIFSALVLAASLVVRPFLSSALGFSVVIVLGALASCVYVPAYYTRFYSLARRSVDEDMFVFAREVTLNSSRVLALALLFLVPWTWGFYFAAASLVVSSLLLSR